MVNCLHGHTTRFYPWPIVAFGLDKRSFRRSYNKWLFADNVSFFSVVDKISLSTTNLNNDLIKINTWASQWKMIFNPDPNKQAQGVIFSCKKKGITLSTEL